MEAEKQGLVVSDEEVDQYLDTLKTYFANSKDADVISLLREFVSGKGMTLNDYIDALKPRYKQQMSFGQLKAKYITDTKTVEEYELKLNQFKANLVSQYQSEITIKLTPKNTVFAIRSELPRRFASTELARWLNTVFLVVFNR